MDKVTQAIQMTRFRLNTLKELKKHEPLTFEAQGGDQEIAYLNLVLELLSAKNRQSSS